MDSTDALSQLLTSVGIDAKTALLLAPWAFGATDYLKRYLGKSDGQVKATAATVSVTLGVLYTLATLGGNPVTGAALLRGVLLGAGTAAFALLIGKGRQQVPDNRPEPVPVTASPILALGATPPAATVVVAPDDNPPAAGDKNL